MLKRDCIRMCAFAAMLIVTLLAPQRADAVVALPHALSLGAIALGHTGGPLAGDRQHLLSGIDYHDLRKWRLRAK
jgi:hypothetical protein